MQVEIDVPDDVLKRLENKAAASGMTVSQFFVRYIEQIAAVPTREEMMERLDRITRADLTRTADALREGREERDEQLGRAISSK
jgi:hypothetical protein